jgi:hypothetical protein
MKDITEKKLDQDDSSVIDFSDDFNDRDLKDDDYSICEIFDEKEKFVATLVPGDNPSGYFYNEKHNILITIGDGSVSYEKDDLNEKWKNVGEWYTKITKDGDYGMFIAE